MSTGNHEVRIGFTGDISFTGVFRERVLNEYEITRYIDTKIIECLAKNDWNVGNIEGPITLVNTPNSAGVALKSPPEVAKVLRRLKINCYNLANNHIMDYGVLGLRDTLDFAYQNDAVPMGAGVDISYASRPVVFEKYDIKLGLLSISHNEGMLATDKKPGVFAERSDELILERIRWLRSCCDWVIINYHGGEEYTFVPSPLRRHRLLRYLNYGADIIIAHHPHVVQGYEQVGNKRIFYSLGNFIFDIPEHSGCKGTDQSVIISSFLKKRVLRLLHFIQKVI